MVQPEVRRRKGPDLRRSRRADPRQGRDVSGVEDAGDLRGRNVDFEQLVAAALDKHGLRGPKADPKTPVILQTFSESSARELARDEDRRAGGVAAATTKGLKTAAQVKEWKGVCTASAPPRHRAAQSGFREMGARRGHDGHAVHLPIVGDRQGRLQGRAEEMEHFLYTLGVDALFTDNPDKFPRK